MPGISQDNKLQYPSFTDTTSIYFLIASNNLNYIHSIFNPLSLHDRQLIVNQKFKQKSLLYHACESGFRDIVKYLLDECGADIEEVYCNTKESTSPMTLAMMNLDFFLMMLLMRRGASVGDQYTNPCHTSYRRIKAGYSMLGPILKSYEEKIDMLLLITPNYLTNEKYLFNHNRKIVSAEKNKQFLLAAANGNISELKTLYQFGANKYAQNIQQDNAMCLAILNEEKNVQNFLLNYRIYSWKSYALALELCGAKFILFRNQTEKAIECWKRSVQIRQEYRLDFSDKIIVKHNEYLGVEFQTEDDINRFTPVDFHVQALMVFLRILTKFNPLTEHAFITALQLGVFREMPFLSLKILSVFYYFPHRKISHCIPRTRAKQEMYSLLRYHFPFIHKDVSEYLNTMINLQEFLHANVWKVLLKTSTSFYRKAYSYLLELVLENIKHIKTYSLTEVQKPWLIEFVTTLVNRRSDPYPISLLEKVKYKNYPLYVVDFLRHCSTNVHCYEFCDDTRFYVASNLAKSSPSLNNQTHLLMAVDVHVDSFPGDSLRSLETRKRKKIPGISMEDNLKNSSFPDAASIYFFIASNNLDYIHLILNPLSLRDRQLIVNQKFTQKSLLYHACESGFRDIVKYLLDECGADIEEVYCNTKESTSPMTLAMMNLDVFLMMLLMRRGASVGDQYTNPCHTSYRRIKAGYSMLGPILKSYEEKIDMLLLITPNYLSNEKYLFNHNRKIVSAEKNKRFLLAAANGNISELKTLYQFGVNKYAQNIQQDNAMCLAILNEEKNVQNFLLNYRIYSWKSYALALELCGAKFILFRNQTEKAIECWKRSVQIRQEYRLDFSDKNIVKYDEYLGVEFQTEDDINRFTPVDFHVQALMVFLRILTKFNPLTEHAFITALQLGVFREMPFLSLKILSVFYYFPPRKISHCIPSTRAEQEMCSLLRYHFPFIHEDVSEYLNTMINLQEFLHANVWKVLLKTSTSFYQKAYSYLLELVLENIKHINTYSLTEVQKPWLIEFVTTLVNRRSDPYPISLLEKVKYKNYPLYVVDFLRYCATNVYCYEFYDDTWFCEASN